MKASWRVTSVSDSRQEARPESATDNYLLSLSSTRLCTGRGASRTTDMRSHEQYVSSHQRHFKEGM